MTQAEFQFSFIWQEDFPYPFLAVNKNNRLDPEDLRHWEFSFQKYVTFHVGYVYLVIHTHDISVMIFLSNFQRNYFNMNILILWLVYGEFVVEA
jgi:hypothetical protein